MSLTLDKTYLKGYIDDKELNNLTPQIEKVHQALTDRSGPGGEMTGWTDLPTRIDEGLLTELTDLGAELRGISDCVVSIGIGGSYLGIRATVEYQRGAALPLYYGGINLSADYHARLLREIQDKDIAVVVISKSGTTTEPALAFRLINELMDKKYSPEEKKKRIVCVTDGSKGALKKVADANGYRTYVIPDDVGGRFSVLTPVGLVPLSIAGVDIQALVAGAREGQTRYSAMDLDANLAYQYAAIRYLLYRQGKVIETTSSFYDNLYYVMEWWKQLYGESEAKQGRGIFPSSLIMSTDLHSMGQLMQDGMRNMFETFLDVESPNEKVTVPEDKDDIDGFNIVAGKDLDYVNTQAYKATASAHFDGGVPNMTIRMPQADLKHLGELYYFYERGVAVSGYLLGVNPFNQPGVEAYKKKMFALLGKT